MTKTEIKKLDQLIEIGEKLIKYPGQITFKILIADGDSKAEGEIDFMLDKDLIADIGFNKAVNQALKKVKALLKQNGVDRWTK
ncbi:MAG: hypothetical protein PHN39_04260 [Candidatus Pacebacteria bacterium]|nr:hypothetical protein [Candidatus Paceibacterota bacterium]